MSAPSLTRPVHPVRTPLSKVRHWAEARLIGDETQVMVSGISLNSNRVQPGDLYVALPGARAHGAAYASEAAASGAVAVLTDAQGADQCAGTGVPVLIVADPRQLVGTLAAQVYGNPGADLCLMGVTGTQGKTTISRLLEAGLTQAGESAAVIGTLGTRIAGHDVSTALTTPEAPDLQGLLAVMCEQGVAGCVIEVSSHALVLHRVDGVVFDVAAFCNLGRDHLDFHRDLEDYFLAKASLFTPEHARMGITNVDDEHGRRLLAEASIPMRTFSASGLKADWRAVEVESSSDGSRFTVITPGGARLRAGVPLTGAFNVDNALCAIALAAEAGFDPEQVISGIAQTSGVPGRLERIDEGQRFLAVVDYAHKPDALVAAVRALRPLTEGRLLLVIGAGGERDTGKRPVMGEIGSRLADILIVTDDNPRGEDPASIRSALLSGANATTAHAEVMEVGDRRTAIRHAISLAEPDDTVLIAGKGHETGQEIAGVIHPFDDREEVRAALAEARR